VKSDLRYAYRTKLEHQLRERPDEYALVKLIGPDAFRDVVETRTVLLGSTGKARP
jgi:fructose-bisphosphate aldolase, class II